MTTTNVDNQKVGVRLSVGESVTVPTGETWLVSIRLDILNADLEIQVNGNPAFSGTVNKADGGNSYTGEMDARKLVFTGGDTIKASNPTTNNPRGAYVSGFVVSN
jgi:hypothetical protein